MKPKTNRGPESVVREIKRKTRRKFNPEEKISIILEGLKGEESIAAICRRELEAASFAVDAAVRADRKLAVQAMLFCPGVTDIDVAERIVDEYLKVHKTFLPKFK